MTNRRNYWVICALVTALGGCGSDVIGGGIGCNHCALDEQCCDGECKNVMTDSEACGACGIVCGAEESCIQGVCKSNGEHCGACPEQWTCCGDGCRDLMSSSTDCGRCGRQCLGGTLCVNGQCVEQTSEPCEDACTDGFICCDGSCVHPDVNSVHCGVCHNACHDNEVCDKGICQCIPKTCEDLNLSCGAAEDGCGNALDCGTCPDGGICTNGICNCIPKTCEDLNLSCGGAEDGCGNALDCGTCSDGGICTNGICNCIPKTCEDLNLSCGGAEDGCGSTLNCGACADGKTCQAGTCVCIPKTCALLGKNCGALNDGCGGTLQCGSCTGNQICESHVCTSPNVRDTYPKRKSIKGLQPDFQDVNQVIGNETHGVAMNLVWEYWQPEQKTSCAAGEIQYDGYCFNPNAGNPAQTAAAIKTYSDAGVVVTAVIYGVPAWARRSCASGSVVMPWFCAPKDGNAKDYGRFVGFLANYFNGENGHGRIADFVIHNEVNASEWFNIGCTKGTCHVDTWTSVYADSWNWAYDYAKKEQKEAKVLISFEHHFGSTYDSMLNNAKPVVSAETFLTNLVPKLGNRDWRIAWHSYPPNLGDPAFGANDWPRITFGNIGVIAGWLRQHYPGDPHAWEIQLTENGLNGNGASMQQRQRTQLCQAFENILGTPGIESFIYHRLIDIAEEGLNLGLWNADKSAKPAWEMFALANRNLGNGWPACGFQHLPYIRMKRGSNSSSMHWITTRQFPSGFNFERAWKILREPAAGTQMVYECRVGGASGNHAMISTDPSCEGQFNMGPMGYVYTTQVSGTSPIYRCYVTANGSHFVSPASNCEGQKTESLIGYAIQE